MLNCWFNKTGILTIFYYYVVASTLHTPITWRNIGRSGKAIKIEDDLCLNLNTSFAFIHIYLFTLA